MDFKETNEVSALLEGAASALNEVRANGKLDMGDIFVLPPLVKLGKDAVQDFSKIQAEFDAGSGEARDAAILRLAKASLDFSAEVSATAKLFVK